MDLPYHFSFLISERTHTVLSCVLALFALVAALRAKDKPSASDWSWIGMIALLLLVGRWPSVWYPHQLNPDESQLLSGVQTLRFDPVFWRSVNGMTSGPLNFFALWPMGSLLGDGYLAARLTALVLITVALFGVHLAVSRQYGATVARVSGLPTLFFLSFNAYADFTHYSSELLSMALIAIALYLATRLVFEGVGGTWREFTIGFLLGCVPLAKPQAAPIAFVLGLALTGWLLFSASVPAPQRKLRVARLVGSALLPVACTVVIIGAYDLGSYVWVSFWLSNRQYVDSPTLSVFRIGFRLLAKTDPASPVFFVWVFSGLAFFALALPWLKTRGKNDTVFITSAAVLLLVAAIAVVIPRRTFPHYLMLLPVPWALLCGGIAGALSRRTDAKRLVALGSFAALSGTALMITAVRAVMPYPLESQFSPYSSDFSGRVTAEIKRYARPDDALTVWGWRSEYHVLTGLRQGTRDALTDSLISPGPYRTYFRKRYLDDIMLSRPAVFVDGVGPGGFYFITRATQAHDVVFPELTAWIRENYVLAADIEGARIYVRDDCYRKAGGA